MSTNRTVVLLLFTSLISLILSHDNHGSDSCAYAAMGMIATPLNSCCVYSMQDTTSMSYSSAYTYDNENNKLQWNYYRDGDCQEWFKSYEMDDIMMQIHHLNIHTSGSGNNCKTVDIRVKGSYSELTDECDANIITDDYYSRSYVIDECIASQMEGYSSILKCNNEAIYFDYYSQCTDCNCAHETFIYEHYANKGNDCYSVTCNSNSVISESVIPYKTESQFLKTLITKQPNTPIFVPQTHKMKKSMPINGKIKQNTSVLQLPQISFWLYGMGIAFVFMVFCGICRYINSFKKEYSQI